MYPLRVPGPRIHQLTRRFDGSSPPALDALELEIGDGEFLAVTGPSGSGKTTLLRLLAGLEVPDSGRIGFGADAEWHRRPVELRGVALVSQQPALLPQLTVAENLGLGLRLRKVSSSETDERVRAMASRLGVETLLHRMPASLSGGEQQRVSLGRALVQRPSLLLLDEPLSQLDAPLRAELRRLIARLARESGVTTVHVTHDQTEALELGNRIAVLRAGRLEQAGAPGEILRRPHNRFVAEFFSPDGWNELKGTLHRGNHAVEFRTAHRSFSLPAIWEPFIDALPVVCLLRPEAFAVENGGEIRGQVVRAWPCSGGWRAEIGTAAGCWIVRFSDKIAPAKGAAVQMGVAWERALWFHADTGLRLENRAGNVTAAPTRPA